MLTVAEEKKLLTQFMTRAEPGDITEISAVRTAWEQQVGQAVARSTVYRLLERHGWRKLAPRPVPPDISLGAQEAFKKAPAFRAQRGRTLSRRRFPPAADV